MKRQCLAAMLTAGFALPALAASTSVATVADLISAVQNANNNDEIVVMASGSPYEFTADQKDVVAHLYARVTITLRGETGNPADVVLVGNANRILYLAAGGNTISGLTFRTGDCTGYEKRSVAEGVPYDQLRGGAIASAQNGDSNTQISNCIFDSCRSVNGGGACGAYALLNSCFGKYDSCVFVNNCSTDGLGGAVFAAYSIDGCTFLTNTTSGAKYGSGGAVYGFGSISRSLFEKNRLTDAGASTKGGGAVYMPTNTRFEGPVIEACDFVANSVSAHYGGAVRSAHSGLSVIGSTFKNNSCNSGCGGALCDVNSIISCTIVSNATSSSAGFGGGAYNCTLTRCFMASNYAYRCGAAADSSLYSCTNCANDGGGYTELGKSSTASSCYAEDCVFLDAGRAAITMFGSCGFNRCRFENMRGGRMFTQYIALTNCLVANGKSVNTYFYNLESDSSLINCTVVSNSWSDKFMSGSKQVLAVENSFFYGNDIPSTAPSVVVAFNNCILSAASNDYIPGSGNYNYYSERATFNAGFVGVEKDPANPFAITRRSPAFAKAGIVEGWMSTATDIRGEGFPRLRDGAVNIGCYQCWDLIPGLCVIIR